MAASTLNLLQSLALLSIETVAQDVKYDVATYGVVAAKAGEKSYEPHS